jgi:hypothetical protein
MTVTIYVPAALRAYRGRFGLFLGPSVGAVLKQIEQSHRRCIDASATDGRGAPSHRSSEFISCAGPSGSRFSASAGTSRILQRFQGSMPTG